MGGRGHEGLEGYWQGYGGVDREGGLCIVACSPPFRATVLSCAHRRALHPWELQVRHNCRDFESTQAQVEILPDSNLVKSLA